jgi:hypothetical protein
MRVSEVDLYPVYGLGLVLLLGLENELLEDRVIPRDNAEKGKPRKCEKRRMVT